MGTVADNLSRLRDSVASACRRSGRDPGEVCVICVTKGRSADEINEVLACGVSVIGENRVQEALLKYSSLIPAPSACSPKLNIAWHLIGHLQTNKVRDAVRIFSLIHSVDSLRLAEAVDKAAFGINKIQDILVQVNVSGEESKYGLSPKDAPEAIRAIGALPNIQVKGLMTIAPFGDDPESARPHFRALRKLRDDISDVLSVPAPGLRILSMGMSDDFEVAVEEGATMIRVGRRIFES